MRLHLNPERSLFMAFGRRESRGRKVGAARERKGRGGVPGARYKRKMGSLRTARSSCICRGNALEKGENGINVVLSDEWIR